RTVRIPEIERILMPNQLRERIGDRPVSVIDKSARRDRFWSDRPHGDHVRWIACLEQKVQDVDGIRNDECPVRILIPKKVLFVRGGFRTLVLRRNRRLETANSFSV